MKKQLYGHCGKCDKNYYKESDVEYTYRNGWKEVRCKKCGELFCKVSQPYHDRLNQNFEVKGICRADLSEYIGEMKAMELEDTTMRYIADEMGEYLQEDYWTCLEEALRKIKLLDKP